MSFMSCPSAILIPSILITFPLSIIGTLHLVLTFGKQFQVNNQQVIQSEFHVSPFLGSLSSSQQPCQWDHTQNKQQWR